MSSVCCSTIYIGVTNDLQRRVKEHKSKRVKGFSSRYNCVFLVYFEEFNSIEEAIKREKQLKKWNRSWKNELIKEKNPDWIDYSKDWK